MAAFPSPQPEPPLRLVEAPANEAASQLRDLYRDEYHRTARLAYLLTGDRHAADDVAHDAFVALYEHWDRVHDDDRRLAYLRATVVNRANTRHRRAATARKHAAPVVALAGHVHESSAEDTALPRVDRADVMAALAELPLRQRSAVVLRHWLRLTESEIAEAMSCSVGSVRTHLARGHAALATRLGDLR